MAAPLRFLAPLREGAVRADSVTPGREVYYMFPALLVLQQRRPEFVFLVETWSRYYITRSWSPERVRAGALFAQGCTGSAGNARVRRAGDNAPCVSALNSCAMYHP